MSTEHKPLSVAKAIELAQKYRPHVDDISALYGLMFHQTEVTLDAQTLADAYAGVARGETLPRLGLSHHGVQIATAFDADDWDRVRAPLRAVARGGLPDVQRFVVESAQRILAVEQIKRLDEGPGSILLAVLDPTCPPATPSVLDEVMAEKGVTIDDLRRALEAAPLARPFVIRTLDAFERAR